MLEKSWILCFSNRVLGELKGRVVKPAGAESCGQRRNQKLHAARSTFSSESTSAPDHFLKDSDVEKLHDAVARRAFSSEDVQNTSASEHFSKFRCRKIARRCGEKHISKSKC